MKNSFKPVIAILYIFMFGLNLYGQGEANNWYFGAGAGITFNGGAAAQLTNSAMNTNEGCASISDANGNLLFYTNGKSVWDATHNVMSNSGLNGGSSSSQAAIIVPDPGNADRYYIFTTGDHATGPLNLSYSVVDMTLNGGLGDVVLASRNTLLQSSVSEKLTAVPHCNGTDFWVIVHTDQSAVYSVYPVTSAGVDPTPIQSNPGGVVTSSAGSNGCIKANLDGTKLANALLYDDVVEIYDFDNTTGVISNALSIGTDSWPYGVEFSPSGNILYFTGGRSLTNGGLPLFSYVCQVDLAAGSNAAISASRSYLYTVDNTNDYYYLPQTAQLGPDGKIYVVCNDSRFLSVIENPDVWGTGANYIEQGVSLGSNASGRQGKLGLPNFYTKFFDIPKDFTFDGECLGSPTSFSLNTSDIDSVLWDFDDLSSGADNNSELFNPNHTFTNSGTYDVQMIAYLPCRNDTVIQQVEIKDSPTASLTSNDVVCPGEDAIFTITGTPNSTITYNIDGGSDQTIVLDGSGNGTVTEAGITANTTINVSNVEEPGASSSTEIGNGLSVVGGATPDNAIGPILAEGTLLDNTNSALLNGSNLSLTLTLEHTVPAGTVITIVVARMSNAGNIDITDGTNTLNFNTGPNDNSQYISFTTGQSTNTLTFTRNGGAVRLDGVEYTYTTPSVGCFAPLSISEMVVMDPCLLPIELVEYQLECTNKGVFVSWTTSSENNNDYFTIERSGDGINFETVANINGAGTSTTQNSYSYIDEYSLPGVNYYRLSQTDYGGLSKTFSVLVKECEAGTKVLLKIIDYLGRETQFKPNVPLIYIYSDGSSEKVYVIEN